MTPEDLPQRIGPYRIVREIGRGGMGVVLLGARDDDAYQKDVAIKVMHTGADAGLLRRFAAERRILATLVHPNIAVLLDGGTTEQGQPYFVMEYVEGLPIDAHCETARLSIDGRLRLFLRVCAAVQHAHQRLVVHRDLKPVNILVTADGTPKLLDFGIAKLLAEDQGPGLTVTAAQMLTPEYASPEQIRGEAITVAADVYALGVVLYRLLTGARPYAPATDRPHEIARAIVEQEPARPSTVQDGLSNDLDTIVLKALQKDPSRRYSSVEAFAGDIKRYLEGRPVLAHADSLAYRAAKFARRHRAGVAAVAALMIAIVGGAVATFWQWRAAVANKATADRRFNDIRSLARAVVFDIHDAIEDLPGATKARALVVQKGLEYLDAAGREATGDLDLQLEVARGYERISEIQGSMGAANLGDSASALASAAKALAMREAAVAASPDDLPALRALARSLRQIAYLKPQKDALELLPRAIGIRQRIAEATGSPDDLYSVAGEHHAYGQQLSEHNRLAESLAEYEQARAGYEARLKSEPNHRQTNISYSLLMKNLGALHQFQQRYGEALSCYQRALELDEARLANEPDSVQAKRTLTYSLGSIGSALASMDRTREAIEFHRRALAIREALLNSDAADASAHLTVVRTYRSIGQLQLRTDPAAAVATFERGLQIAGPASGQTPDVAVMAGWINAGLGDAQVKLATAGPAATRATHSRQALGYYERAVEIFETARVKEVMSPPDSAALTSVKAAIPKVRAEAAQPER